jgi:hypothetical protein
LKGLSQPRQIKPATISISTSSRIRKARFAKGRGQKQSYFVGATEINDLGYKGSILREGYGVE